MPHFHYKEQLGSARLDSIVNVLFWFSIVDSTWYFFRYQLGRGSKRAELILKGVVKTLQTTDWSESLLVTRIVLNLSKINMETTTALWSPVEQAS